MVRILAFLIILIGFCIFLRRYRAQPGNQARGNDGRTVKEKQKPTLFDVRRLLLDGKKEQAVRIYCQIFAATPNEAKKAVEELEKNLK